MESRKAEVLNMAKKRWLVLVLAMLMLASCGAKDNGGESMDTTADTTGNDNTTAAAETEAETDSLEARKLVDDGLGKQDFGGKEYRMLYQVRYANFQNAEELTGDVLNDAVYTRNMTVEDRLNVKLVHNTGEEDALAQHIKNSALSGNDEYDLYLGHTMYTGQYAVQGIFRNWYDTSVDFSKPWFPQTAIQNLTLNGKMFLTASDICLSLASNAYCYYFNKDLAEVNGLEDMYDVVNRGDWTLDYLMTNVASIYQDINGDGAATEEDLYGFLGEKTNSVVAYLYSFKIPTAEIDDTGKLSIVLGTDERGVDAMDRLRTLLYDTVGSYPKDADFTSMFSGQHAMFVTGVLDESVSAYRDSCDFDYGIIPYPKYDTAQDGYYTVAGGSVSSSAIPITVSDLDLISACFTALSAENWKTVIPAYYDVTLKYKGARDEASIAMIDTILAGRNLDFAFMYDAFKGYMYKMKDFVQGNVALPTYVEKTRNGVEKHFEAVQELFFPEV
jgi:lipoprotein